MGQKKTVRERAEEAYRQVRKEANRQLEQSAPVQTGLLAGLNTQSLPRPGDSFRVGTRVPRNLYWVSDRHPEGLDVGRIDLAELAAWIVDAANNKIRGMGDRELTEPASQVLAKVTLERDQLRKRLKALEGYRDAALGLLKARLVELVQLRSELAKVTAVEPAPGTLDGVKQRADHYRRLSHQIGTWGSPDLCKAAAQSADDVDGLVAEVRRLRRQVVALLADRDRWAKVSGKWADETIAARNERDDAREDLDAARAELAKVTLERDQLRAKLVEVTADRNHLHRLVGGREGIRAPLGPAPDPGDYGLPNTPAGALRWYADREGGPWGVTLRRWAEQTEEGHDAIRAKLAEAERHHDLAVARNAELVTERDRFDAEATKWKTRLVSETAELRDRLAAARTELATARRDAAVDAWDRAARYLDEFFDNDSAEAAAVTFREWIAEVNAEIRAGTRPVPGSPQPAGEDEHHD